MAVWVGHIGGAHREIEMNKVDCSVCEIASVQLKRVWSKAKMTVFANTQAQTAKPVKSFVLLWVVVFE